MPILDARHDFGHPVEPDSAWSESYYFNAYDPVTDTGLFTRIGIRPNEGTMDVGLSLWLPGAELAAVRGVRPQREMTDDGLAVGGVRQARQLVGTAPLGRPADVALVLDQRRRRGALRRHPHRHRRGRSPPRLGLARRDLREHPVLGRADRARARRPHAPGDPRPCD